MSVRQYPDLHFQENPCQLPSQEETRNRQQEIENFASWLTSVFNSNNLDRL